MGPADKVRRQAVSAMSPVIDSSAPTRSLGVIAALMKNDTQQMQAVEMVGLCCKNFIVSLLRLRQPTGLMQREGFGQQ
jgi:hypothetical protein